MTTGSMRSRALLNLSLLSLLLATSATTASPRVEVESERHEALEEASELVTHSAEQLDKMIVETEEQSTRVLPAAGAVTAVLCGAAFASWIFRRRKWEPHTPEGSPANQVSCETFERGSLSAWSSEFQPSEGVRPDELKVREVEILTPRPSLKEDQQQQQQQTQPWTGRWRALLSQLKPFRSRPRPATAPPAQSFV